MEVLKKRKDGKPQKIRREGKVVSFSYASRAIPNKEMGSSRQGKDPYNYISGSWVAGPLPVSFVLPSVFCSFLLPPYAHQLPGFGWMVSPSTLIHFFRSLLLVSFLGIVAC